MTTASGTVRNSNSCEAITAPLKIVQELYRKRASSLSDVYPRDFGVEDYFKELMGDESAALSIPVVTMETIDAIPNDTLVTYVGMVQDMFNPEYFVSEYTDASGAWRTTRYGDTFVDGNDGGRHDGDVAVDGGQGERRFDERHPVLVVPVPGQSTWVSEREREAARASVVKFNGSGRVVGGHVVERGGAPGKRQLEGDSMEIDMDNGRGEVGNGVADRDAGDPSDAGGAVKKVVTVDTCSAGQQGLDPRGSNSSAGIRPGSCVVHFYHANAVKLNDVVQVLGVISRVPELASGGMLGMADEDEAALASRIPTSVAPRIHAISVRRLGISGMPSSSHSIVPKASPAGSSVREGIVRFLANVLGGDSLAAEYVLMQLISRVHRRTQGGVGLAGGQGQDSQAQLGMAALNITGVSGDRREGAEGAEGEERVEKAERCARSSVGRDCSSFAAHLGEALSFLMPSVVTLPLDIDALNRRPWYPTKMNDDRSSEAVLQLPAGTVLVLDETAMSAGELTETGLKNLGAIQTMMQSQKLPYDFQFYRLEQPTDQPIIISSIGRTMLKGAGEIEVPLAERERGTQAPGARADIGYNGNIDAARGYLAAVRSMDFSIPQELETQIENDMTEARKKDSANITAETFHRWLNLARLLCLSHGETALSLDRWRQVLAMEAERVKRIAAKR